jgi:hypothetical protein
MTGELIGFAYGEDLEEGSQRSLGYRLLAPTPVAPWCAEVEALARRLQAAPYSDHWPATGLFCSVLLADGRRLVALARYGLTDHTPDRRRGGLDLLGVIAPATLDVPGALAVYRWLQQRRAASEGVPRLEGAFQLGDVSAVVPPAPVEQAHPRPAGWAGPGPVLPVRLWQEGALLFAACTPSDPDLSLRLLEAATGPDWQWLPLVGPDFPLASCAQRGALVAWTPHLTGVAVQLGARISEAPRRGTAPRLWAGRLLIVVVVLLLAALLVGNLWYLREIQQKVSAAAPSASGPDPSPARPVRPTGHEDEGASRERFGGALHQLLLDKGAERELTAEPAALRGSDRGAQGPARARRRPQGTGNRGRRRRPGRAQRRARRGAGAQGPDRQGLQRSGDRRRLQTRPPAVRPQEALRHCQRLACLEALR